MKRKLVFFDRDGVVNLEDEPYGYKIETFYFAPYFMDLFLELKAQNALCFLVTNQSGINRGIFSENDFRILSNFMQSSICSNLTIPLRKRGFVPENVGFDGIYFCPHMPDENCQCRKPKAKMLESALSEFSLDINNFDSYIIGDKDSDMQAGLKVGVQCRILLGDKITQNATCVARDLREVIEIFSKK